MKAFHKSIRWRLQVWHGLVLFVVLAAFGVTTFNFIRQSQLKRVDEELRKRVLALRPVLMELGLPDELPFGPPRWWLRNDLPRRSREPTSAVHLRADQQALFDGEGQRAYYFVIWSASGKLLHRSSTAPADVPMPEPKNGLFKELHLLTNSALATNMAVPWIATNSPKPWLPQFPGGTEAFSGEVRVRDGLRERAATDPLGIRLVVGHPLEAERTELHQLAWLLSGVGGAVLLLGLIVGWWLSGRALQPIAEMGMTARRIAAGNLSERIAVTERDDELRELGLILNDTFERLQSAIARQSQFVADASHELRTPTFVILSQAQSALKRARTAAEYREGFEVCERAARQMRDLVESLLLLARQDSGRSDLRREPCALDQITAEAVQMLRPLAAERQITISTDLQTASLLGDPRQLGQLVVNLVSNAIEYNWPGGEVQVTLTLQDRQTVLTVRDNGLGISADALPHVFERFYRADKSRGAAGGHTGLGLAICKAVVDAHAGEICTTSQLGIGTTFVVRFPPGDR